MLGQQITTDSGRSEISRHRGYDPRQPLPLVGNAVLLLLAAHLGKHF